MKHDSAGTVVVLAIILLLLFGGGNSPFTPSSPPPYVSPNPTFIVDVNDVPQARIDLATTHPGVLDAIDDWAAEHKVEYRLTNANDTEPPKFDMDWVQAAWKVVDHTHPPSIVGASAKVGIKPQPLPKTPEEAVKLLTPLAP